MNCVCTSDSLKSECASNDLCSYIKSNRQFGNVISYNICFILQCRYCAKVYVLCSICASSVHHINYYYGAHVSFVWLTFLIKFKVSKERDALYFRNANNNILSSSLILNSSNITYFLIPHHIHTLHKQNTLRFVYACTYSSSYKATFMWIYSLYTHVRTNVSFILPHI